MTSSSTCITLSSDVLSRFISRSHRKRKDEDDVTFVSRITHIDLQKCGLSSTEGILKCRNAIVIRLNDNHLQSLEDISQCQGLTQLYVANNDITCLDDIHHLQFLTKLHVAGNSIQTVSGLESVPSLRELYLQYQHIHNCQPMYFQPSTLSILANSLTILDISGTNVTQLAPFSVLNKLTSFSAADNQLSDFQDLESAFQPMYYLKVLKLNGNPFCTDRKYRDKVITSCHKLMKLDGHEITDVQRKFLVNWKAVRQKRHLRN